MKLLLIFNPHAANGRAAKLLPEVERLFNDHLIDIETATTKAPGHARELATKADFNRYDGIVAAGGDGTLFEVVNGYYANPSPKRPPLGVLPTGTGNAFARDLDLRSNDWQKAIAIIAANQRRKIDVGRFKMAGQNFYFLNILGLGFVADVSNTAHSLKIFGNTAYTLGVFYQLAFLKTHRLKLEIDGQTLERENIFVEISNTRYTGTSFLMAPEAELDDGLLDTTLLNKKSRLGILKIFPTIFDGTHVNKDGVEVFKTQSLRIETEPLKVLTPDGEVMGQTPIEVSCLQQDVEMFWPR